MRFELWNGNCVVYDFSTITKVFPSLESENAVKYYTQNDKDNYTTTILKNKEEVKRFVDAYEEYVMLKNFSSVSEHFLLKKVQNANKELIEENDSYKESYKTLKESFERQKEELVELKNKYNLLLDNQIESQLSKQNETKAEESFSCTSVERKLLDKLSEGKEIRSYLDSNNQLHFYVYTDAKPVVGDLVEINISTRLSEIHIVHGIFDSKITTKDIEGKKRAVAHLSNRTYRTIKLL